MNWQPIESAPKDQTAVMVYLRQPFDGEHIFIARQNMHGDWSHHVELVKGRGGPLFYLDPAETLTITHWMPLPEAPK